MVNIIPFSAPVKWSWSFEKKDFDQNEFPSRDAAIEAAYKWFDEKCDDPHQEIWIVSYTDDLTILTGECYTLAADQDGGGWEEHCKGMRQSWQRDLI